MHKSSNFLIVVAVMITVFCWGSAFVGIRYGLTQFHPGSLALLRFSIASFCMVIVYHGFRKGAHSQARPVDILKMMALGMIGMGCYNILLGIGETSVSSGMAGFVASQIPVFSALLAVIFLKERLGKIGYLGFVISTLGVAMMVLNFNSAFEFNTGALYILAAAFCAAVLFVLQKPVLKNIKPIEAAIYAVWGATLILLINLPELRHDLSHASLSTIVTVIYLGIFPTCVAYSTWGYAISKAPATKVTSALYGMPVVAAILGWLLLGEVITIKTIIGGIFALMGTMCVAKAQHAKVSTIHK